MCDFSPLPPHLQLWRLLAFVKYTETFLRFHSYFCTCERCFEPFKFASFKADVRNEEAKAAAFSDLRLVVQ